MYTYQDNDNQYSLNYDALDTLRQRGMNNRQREWAAQLKADLAAYDLSSGQFGSVMSVVLFAVVALAVVFVISKLLKAWKG